MTITVDASRFPVEQITKQLDKLINVIKIRDLDPENMVSRELAPDEGGRRRQTRSEVIQLVEIFEAQDHRRHPRVAHHPGDRGDRRAPELRAAPPPFGLIELVKTGVVALGRGGVGHLTRASRPPHPAPGAHTVPMYYDQDADLGLLKGKTIAIIGYGSQGHAQAQNLRDSGCDVVVGQRPGSASSTPAPRTASSAVSAAERRRGGDLVNILLPDEVQGDIYREDIAPHLRPGNSCCSRTGSTSTSARSSRPRASTCSWSPPRAPATWSAAVHQGRRRALPDRRRHQDATGTAKALALAYAKGIGGTRAGVLQTTFAEETETDLFGEQVVLCGGVTALVQAGFETLIEAGYQPESGLLRVPARAEADRRPDVPGRPQLHALQHLEHGRVRRLHPRAAGSSPSDTRRDEEDPRARSRPASSPASGSSRTRPAGPASTPPSAASASTRSSRSASGSAA